jgi:hypothetical protein
MISIRTFIKGWDGFFYRTTDASRLCLFRAFLGFFLLLNGLSLIEDFEAWLGTGDNSLLPLHNSFYFYSDFRINFFKWLTPEESSAWFVLIVYILSAFLMMIGFQTKVSTIICFVLLVSLHTRNHAILNSGDNIMRCMLFLMMFAPTHVKYSVDSWFRSRQGNAYSTQISYVSLRLLQLQFSLVYLATTLFKLKGVDWPDGTAIYYTSRLVNFQRFVLPVLFDYVWLIKLFTWSALFIEFAMGTLVWVKEFRIWVLLAGIMLHLGIEVTMSIGFFEWVMISAYILFLEPKDLLGFKNLFWFQKPRLEKAS